jgi:hypothetical protein
MPGLSAFTGLARGPLKNYLWLEGVRHDDVVLDGVATPIIKVCKLRRRKMTLKI